MMSWGTSHDVMCTSHDVMCTSHDVMCTSHDVMCTSHVMDTSTVSQALYDGAGIGLDDTIMEEDEEEGLVSCVCGGRRRGVCKGGCEVCL